MLVRIFPDSNAFERDPFLRTPTSVAFLKALEPGRAQVAIPPVVQAEIDRHLRRDTSEALAALRKSLRTVARRSNADISAVESASAALAEALTDEATTSMGALRKHETTIAINWPTVSSEDLAARELMLRRPTMVKDGQSIGLRDTIVWHSVLENLPEGSADVAVLITADKGFLSSTGELHADLQSDLAEWGFDAARFVVVADVSSATTEVQRLLDVIGEREAAALRAMNQYMRSLGTLDWVGHFDPATGTVLSPETSPAGAPDWLDDVLVTEVEVQDVTLVSNDSPLVARGTAVVFMEGYARADGFYADIYDGVEVLGGDGDPYITVSFPIRVEVEAEISVTAADMEASIDLVRFSQLPDAMYF